MIFAGLFVLSWTGPVLWAQNSEMSVEDFLNQFEQQRNSPGSSSIPAPMPSGPPVPTAAPEEPQVVPVQEDYSVPSVEIAMNEEENADGINARIDVLDLKGMEIQDFLKLVSQKSGKNVVAGPNVRGKMTIYLKDVTIKEALHIVLEANDLAYVEDGNVIKVMTAKDFEVKFGYKFGDKLQTKIIKLTYANVLDMVTILNQMKNLSGKVIFDHKSNTLVLMDAPVKLAEMEALIKQIDVPVETEVFDLSYADAKEVAEKIGETLTLNVGKIKHDVRSNRIIISDTPTKIAEIDKIIQAFDVKQREVLIEAKIIQIVLNDEHKMGVDWEAIVSDYHALNLKGDFDILTSSEKRGQVSVGTLSSDDYTFLIDALETVGKTNILSNPSITAVNNKEAKILVGSTQPYVTTTTTTPSSGPTTTAESVNFIDVGVKLFVTPTIHMDDFITMKIKPEVSSVTSSLTTSNNNTIPIVETSEAETVVTVKNNVTIVIGGLIKEEKLSTVRKVPFLGDLPLLGLAFRNQSQSLEKTELVIFLTPKIITGDVPEADRLQGMENVIQKKYNRLNP